MENNFKTVATVTLTVLYGFLLSFCNGGTYFQHSSFTKQRIQPQTENVKEAISKTVFCHTTPTENALSLFNNASPVPFKNQFTDHADFVAINDRVLTAKFLQYSFFSKNILSRLSQYDIIFPFHYFW